MLAALTQGIAMVASGLIHVDIGWSVHASDGAKVGQIEELGPGYLVVDPGLLRSALYVPLQAILSVDLEARSVALGVTAADVATTGWQEPIIDASADGGW